MGSSGALPNTTGTVNVGDLVVADDATIGDDLAVTGDATIGATLKVTPGAAIEIGADTNLYRLAANSIATDDSFTVGGTLLVATGGTSINAVDRAAVTNFAAYVLRTATADRWSVQMTNDSTNDLKVTDAANGTTALLAEARATAPNLSLLTATKSYGGGVGVIFLPNASTNPSTNPTGGGVLYVNAGALTYRGSGGTVTVLGPA